MDHFVPGQERWDNARYKGKATWKEILLVSNTAPAEYAKRVTMDFDTAVGKSATAKVKASVFLATIGQPKGLLTWFCCCVSVLFCLSEKCAAHGRATSCAHGPCPALDLGSTKAGLQHGWQRSGSFGCNVEARAPHLPLSQARGRFAY